MEKASTPEPQKAPTPRIVAADRLADGLVLRFGDGQIGFFSDAYLFSKLSESEHLREGDVEW
jgi:hypothetical protein